MAQKGDSSPEPSNPEPSALTRRQLLPLLGAVGAAAVSPQVFATGSGTHHKPSTLVPRYVYVGTYTAPDVPPGGTHPSTARGITCSGWSRATAT